MKKLTYFPDANALAYTEIASDYVDVRALAANTAKSFTRPVASAKIVFSANPAVGDTVTINNVTLTAVASSPTATQFIPSATLALTLAALVTQFGGLSVVPAASFTVTDSNTSLTATNTAHNVPASMRAIKGGTDGIPFAAYSAKEGARFCRLSTGALFYYSVGGTATVAGSDITNGAGSISVPATVQPMFNVDDVTTISVIAPAICVVSAEWWS